MCSFDIFVGSFSLSISKACIYIVHLINYVAFFFSDFGQPDYEFADICKVYLGNWGYYISIVFSLLSLAGAAAVYWVLMTNFLYNSVLFIYGKM